jgi:transglutaminase-like putative cysteine protease
MIRLTFDIELSYEIIGYPSDFIFSIHAAHTAQQTIVNEQLSLSQPATSVIFVDPTFGTRYLRLNAQPGPFTVNYSATVDINHHAAQADSLHEVPIAELPPEVLRYIYPSRYCQSDRFGRLATWEFAHFAPGYTRVAAIQDWVRRRTAFLSGSTDSNTSAADTVVEQAGVCRDFAHLMIALCRAMNIPARFVTGIDYGAALELGPTDFHAYVEVFLSHRWYAFDPTGISPPMGLIRLGTGRDAADTAFATVFGTVTSRAPIINISALDDPANGFILPWRCDEILSTHAGISTIA